MTALVWDQVGDRTYQTGVDRGVLYLPDGTAAAWNGLTSVDEKFSHERNEYYLDGVKYLEDVLPGDFSASLKAFTYPDEFERINGVTSDNNGLFVHDQKPMSFGLSYRTLIGDDVSGIDRGYKIHLLYNLLAIPDSNAYTSLNDQSNPIEFGWDLSGTPVGIPGYRATAHISLDSTKMDSHLLTLIESELYGSDENDPRLPLYQDLFNIIILWNTPPIVTDNGDGTWTATGASVHLHSISEFEILNIPATYLDPNTYEIATT
jgi:hypothetical protein